MNNSELIQQYLLGTLSDDQVAALEERLSAANPCDVSSRWPLRSTRDSAM